MPVEFTQDETAALIDLLVGTIERYPFPQSPHIQRLRGILEKIRPIPALLKRRGSGDRCARDGGQLAFSPRFSALGHLPQQLTPARSIPGRPRAGAA
jgi:hypothetical protein